MQSGAILLGIALIGALAGCSHGKEAFSYAPAAEEAPEFSSSASISDLPSFLVGEWGMTSITDREFAKQLGVESLIDEEVDTNSVFEFKPGGVFQVRDKGSGWVVEGSWQLVGDRVTLQYQKVDGLEWSAAKEEVRKRDESGRASGVATDVLMDWLFTELPNYHTLRLAPDRKRLVFLGTSAIETMGMSARPGGANAPPMSARGLARLVRKKAE